MTHSFGSLFARVSRHLQSLGIQTVLEVSPNELGDLEQLRQALGCQVPETMQQLYEEMGGGILFGWGLDGDDSDPCGVVEVPSAKTLAGWHREYLQCEAQLEGGGRPNILAVISLGNGDFFGIGMADAERAVFIDHRDRVVTEIAGSFGDFVGEWGSMCFQLPSDLYWPRVLGDHAIDWTSSKFDRRFKLRADSEQLG